VGISSTDRLVLAGKLRPVPKFIEKTLWEMLAVRDPEAPVVTNRKGESEPAPELRDNENVPLLVEPATWAADPSPRLASTECRSLVADYMREQVLPFVSDAWVDHEKTKIGYEIPLTRHFHKYVPPRPLREIDADIEALEAEIQVLLGEIAK
jgi:type I restriction enzyme M protein